MILSNRDAPHGKQAINNPLNFPRESDIIMPFRRQDMCQFKREFRNHYAPLR